ncbi:MAG: YceI family protein [Planctomycetota bacterium]
MAQLVLLLRVSAWLVLFSVVLVGCAGTQVPPPDAPPGRFVADPARSSVTFTIDKNQRPIDGRFGAVSGSYTPPSGTRSGELYAAVAVGSVDTGNGLRDGEIQQADYFNAETHPAVDFRAAVRPADGDADTLTADGTLSLLGVERPLSVTLTPVPNASDGPAHRTTFAIDRSDFGFTIGLANGSIGDRVDLTVKLHWVPSAPASGSNPAPGSVSGSTDGSAAADGAPKGPVKRRIPGYR